MKTETGGKLKNLIMKADMELKLQTEENRALRCKTEDKAWKSRLGETGQSWKQWWTENKREDGEASSLQNTAGKNPKKRVIYQAL